MDTTFGGGFEPGSEAYFLDTCLFPPDTQAAVEAALTEGLAATYINDLYALPEIADLRTLEFRLAKVLLPTPFATRVQVEQFFTLLEVSIGVSGMNTQFLHREMQEAYVQPQFTMAALQVALEGFESKIGNSVFNENLRGLHQLCGILHFTARLLWFGPGQREYSSDIELTGQSAEVIATLVRWRRKQGF